MNKHLSSTEYELWHTLLHHAIDNAYHGLYILEQIDSRRNDLLRKMGSGIYYIRDMAVYTALSSLDLLYREQDRSITMLKLINIFLEEDILTLRQHHRLEHKINRIRTSLGDLRIYGNKVLHHLDKNGFEGLLVLGNPINMRKAICETLLLLIKLDDLAENKGLLPNRYLGEKSIAEKDIDLLFARMIS